MSILHTAARRTLAAAALLLAGTAAFAQDLPKVDVGVLAYGTAQWEMKVIKDRHLDTDNGVELVVHDLGSDDAGDIALQAGKVDVILTDFIWVSIQRSRGRDITLVPHSKAVGGLMLAPGSDIASLDDLPGHTLGIAGGPVDKSWIILQAYWASTHDAPLPDQLDTRFAPPPLLLELLKGGKLDAGLNFWHYNARAKAAGMTQLISVTDMLKALDLPEDTPLLGWAFRESTAAEKPEAIRGFLAASRAAKQLMLDDDALWETLRGKMKAEDDATFTALRDAYREGILASTDPEAPKAAAKIFALMAKYGGPDLTGDSPALADGTFWTGDDAN